MCSRAFRSFLLAVVALGFGLAGAPCLAHGPTVKLSYGRVQPAELTVTVGQTVHFLNTNSAPGKVTLVVGEGGFNIPPLARAEDWHHTFDAPGRFSFYLAEFPARKGTIVVVPAPP